MQPTEDMGPNDLADRSQQTPTVLDLRGVRCPMPVLRTRKALATLASGALLIVECTDPLAGIDIPHLVNQNGDALLEAAFREGVHVFSIRKR